MSITLSPLSPISPLYTASTSSIPYTPTSLPINSSQDVVITSDYPLLFNEDKNGVSVRPAFPMFPYYPYYTTPLVVPTYENLNRNPEVQERLTKYFYYKTLDDWLYDDLSSLMRHLKVSGNSVHVVKSEGDMDKEDISQEAFDKKVEYVEKNIFSKDDMFDILMKIMNEADISLVKLPQNEYIVQGYVKKWLKKEFSKHK